MPAATRISDKNTGHGGYPSTTAETGSSNVFINGLGAHRTGDTWVAHNKKKGTLHPDTTGPGSSSVFINGSSCARFGDSIVDGGAIAQGSGNVFVGG